MLQWQKKKNTKRDFNKERKAKNNFFPPFLFTRIIKEWWEKM